MDLDEEQPRKPSGYEIGSDLSTLSVEELKALIGTLEGEIARIEMALGEKESSRAAADSVFKT